MSTISPARARRLIDVRARDTLPLLDRHAPAADICAELVRLYDSVVCEVPAEAGPQVARIIEHQGRYRDVSAALGGRIPWAVIGVIHAMEGGLDFRTHLHNGDPLTRQTVHVPAGRPQGQSGPFTWEESAADALTMKDWHLRTDWALGPMLWRIERYNGLGYRRPARPPSPYLWAGSNHERAGKYIGDGQYDPRAVSAQVGAAVLLKLIAVHTAA